MIDFNIDNYLRISPSDVILVLISTFLIVLFAKKFFWNKLLVFVQKRQQLIQDNIDSSEKIRNEAMDEKALYDAKLKNAGQEAHAIIEEAKAQAAEEKTQILKDARQQADRMSAAAREEIEREKLSAEKDMKNAISSVALCAAEALVKSEMDDGKREAFVADFIDQARETSQWPNP